MLRTQAFSPQEIGESYFPAEGILSLVPHLSGNTWAGAASLPEIRFEGCCGGPTHRPQGGPRAGDGGLSTPLPNLGKGHHFSQKMSQFSSKFSKALVTHTPKEIKSPCSQARGLGRRVPILKPAGPYRRPSVSKGSSAVLLCFVIPPRWVG